MIDIKPEDIINGEKIIKTTCKTCKFRMIESLGSEGEYDRCGTPDPATGFKKDQYIVLKRKYFYPGECSDWAFKEPTKSKITSFFKKLFDKIRGTK